MPIPVIMPKLEMSQETGRLISWNKQEGEQVKKGEILFTVETDKITIDVESPGSGQLAGVSAQSGDVVPVTTVVAVLLQPGESLPAAPSEQHAPPAAEKSQVNVTPLAKRMTEKEGIEISNLKGSGPKGKITRADVEEAILNKVRSSPAARRFANEKGVDLAEISGSGPRGRIQSTDVQNHLDELAAGSITPPASHPVEVIKLSNMRRTIAERMVASYQNAPHIYLSSSIDAGNLLALKDRMNAHASKENGAHVSMTALFTKAVAWALKRWPLVNSSLRGEEIFIQPEINVGIAVALEDGLIVPVVRNCGHLPVAEIASEINNLVEKAKKRTLTPADVSGGTFTISNLGPYGIDEFTAIINPGQAAILAIGAVNRIPVGVGDTIQLRPIFKITLSCDHRIIDGAIAAQFLASLKAVMEDPGLALY